MSGSKRYVPFVMACLFLGTSTGAIAERSQSLLDPYNYIPPPKTKAKSTPRASEAESAQTYVTMPGTEEDPKPTVTKAPKAPKVAKAPKEHKSKEPKSEVAAAQQEANPKANQGKRMADGIASKTKDLGGGIAGKTKDFGGGIASKTKDIGGGIATKTKGIGGGIASATKASGGFFAKGAKAIGSGLKSTGSKVKDGTSAVGSKVTSLPHLGKSDSGAKAPKTAAAAQTGVRTTFGQVYPDTQQPLQQQAPPAKVATAPNKVPGQKGFFGKTVSKLPFFGHKNESIAAPEGSIPH